MTRATNVRRTTGGILAAGVACAALTLPSASAAPNDPTPTDPTPTAAEPTPTAGSTPAAEPSQECNAAGLASTISSVTADLSKYFTAHPDVNQALIDATHQPSFVAVGQFDDYFRDHPEQGNDLRAIQAPLAAFKDRCGLQVSPTDALAVLAEV